MYKLLLPHVFPDEPPMRMVTRDFVKQASFCPPGIQEFCGSVKPEDGHTYIHLNALGEDETWGANSNGDAFPRKALLHKGASHGYKTFEMYAHAYQHHVNKDPAKAMGQVKIAEWNPKMRRVELIVKVSNQRGSGLIEKVASGEYPEWSMGCKVPYDVCSICGNQAKKVANYCEHLKYAMNKILDDGRRVKAINDFPKFFDISEVVIGADKVAKTLRKVASSGKTYSSALLGQSYYGEDEGKFPRVPEQVKADREKVAAEDCSKEELAVGMKLYRTEPEFTQDVISKLAEFPIEETLSTLSFSGIVLHPAEFQNLVLTKAGNGDLAKKLASKGIVFPRITEDDAGLLEPEDDGSISPEHVSEKIFKVASEYMPFRSILNPYMGSRIDSLPILREQPQPSNITWIKTADAGLLELLGTLGLSYFLYRRGFPMEAKAFERVMVKKPWIGPAILGGAAGTVGLSNALAGPSPRALAEHQLRQAHIKVGGVAKTVGTVLGPVALSYLAAASAARKELTGRPLNPVESMIRHYPGPVGVLGVYGLLKGRKSLGRMFSKKLPKL